MSDTTTEQLDVRLVGDYSTLDKSLVSALQLLDKFVAGVNTRVAKVTGIIDTGLSSIGTGVEKLNKGLASVDQSLTTTAQKAQGVVAPLQSAKSALSDVADAADKASRKASNVGSSFEKLESKTTSSMGGVGTAIAGGVKALDALVTQIDAARAAASKPINLRVNAPSNAGGSSGNNSGNGGSGGSGESSFLSGYAALSAGRAVLGGVQQATEAATDFDTALRSLYATAGETTPIADLKSQLLGLATAVKMDPTQLAQGLYTVRSLGYEGAAGLNVLRDAAKLARATNGDLDTSTQMVVQTLRSYSMGADQSGHVTDIFTRAIQASRVQGKEFAPAWAGVLDTAKNVGLTTEEAAAGLAVLTQTAKSAATGSTYLKSFLSGLVRPSQEAAKAAKAAGLDWLAAGQAQAHIKQVGFGNSLKEISHATNGGESKSLGLLFPDLRKEGAAFGLLRDQVGGYDGALKKIQTSAGATDRANQVMNKGLKSVSDSFGVAGKVAIVKFVDALAPMITSVTGGMTRLITGFNNLSAPVQKFIGYATVVVGGLLSLGGAISIGTKWVTGFAEVWTETLAPAVASGIAALGPVLPIILAIVAVVALLATAWATDFGHIREVTASIIDWMRPYIAGAASWISAKWQELSASLIKFWKQIAPEVQQVMLFIGGFLRLQLGILRTYFETWGPAVWGVIRAIWDVIVGIFKLAFDAILGAVRIALDILTGHWSKLWTDLKDIAGNLGSDMVNMVGHVLIDLENGFLKTLDSIKAYWGDFWKSLSSGADITTAMDAGSDAASKAHGGQTLTEATAAAHPAGAAGAATPALTAKAAPAAKPAALPKTPGWADALGNGKGHHGGGGGFHSEMPMPNLGNLEPLEALVGKNPLAHDTNASNYQAQVQALKDRFTEKEIAAIEAAKKPGGAPFDADAFKRQELGHSLNLNSNAATNTKAAIADLLPAAEKAEAGVKKLRSELNALRKEMSGGKPSAGQKKHYSDLLGTYNTAKSGYDGKKRELDENRRVYSEAINGKAENARQLMQMNAEALTRSRSGWLENQKASLAAGLNDPTATGAQNRDQYDEQLKGAIARITAENGPNSPDLKAFKAALEESVKAREAANKEVRTAIARLSKNDFDLKQGEIDAEAGRRRAAGEDDGSVAAWQTAATGQNNRARFTHTFEEGDAGQKASIDDGTESLEEYQQFLGRMRDAAVGAFGEADVLVAKLNRDLDHNGWAIVAQQAEAAKASFDEGGMSLDAYRNRLIQLRSGIAATSPEFKALSHEIEQLATQRIAEQTQAAKEAFESGALSAEQYRARLHQLLTTVAEGSPAYRQLTGSMLDLDRQMVDSSRQTASEIGARMTDVVTKITDNVNGARATIRGFAKDLGAEILKRNIQAGLSKLVFKAESGTDGKLQQAQAEIKIAADKQASAGQLMDAAADKMVQAAQIAQVPSGGGGGGGGDSDDDDDTEEADGDDSSGKAAAIGKGVSVAGQVAGAAKGGAGALGDAAGAVSTAAKTGWLGKAMGAAVPYIGVALAGYSLLSGLFGSHGKPDYASHTGEGAGAALGRGDHSGLFDSGYGGSASLRSLLSQSTAKASTAQASRQTTNHITLTVNALPHHNEMQIAQNVVSILNQRGQHDAMQDAGTPTLK